jgi:membrane protein implicated in regulation of membrane protease activity
MDLSASTLWWLATGALVVLELTSGTFYLLMLALGAAAGALAAHLGLPTPAQVAVAAVVGGGATALLHWRRRRHPQGAPAAQNRDLHLDIGATVQVSHWNPDGTTRVDHRGTQWNARLEHGHSGQPGPHRISAVEATGLVLVPLHPAA